MSKQRHHTALVVGSILGGVAGAAAALWNAPQSGAELRSRIPGLGGAGNSPARSGDEPRTWSADPGGNTWRPSKVLGAIERATAPIVGVKLGQTADDGSAAARTEPAATQNAPAGSTSGEPAAQGVGHVASTDELLTPTDADIAHVPDEERPASFHQFPDVSDPGKPSSAS